MISINEILNPKTYRVFRVYNRELALHFERKGFEVIGTAGDVDGVKSATQFNLYGDIRKLTEREKPYIELFGKLHKKGEKTHGKA